MRKSNLLFVTLLLVSTMILVACGGDQEPTQGDVAQVPTATEEHMEMEEEEHAEGEEHADEPAVAEGLALFRSAGCAGCHGQDGEGGTGPALAGHTAEQVQRQVRTPRGDVMPAFGEEQVSDEQLSLIIAWVESLGPATGEHEHEHAEGEEASAEPDQAASVAAHLRLAYFAVQDDNAHDAEHHLEDLITLLEDEHTIAEVEEILADIDTGVELHDIAHEIEHLMEDMQPDIGELDDADFHLQLALDGLTLDDLEAAGHHLEHYAELVDDADLAATARELQTHLEQGDVHEVEEEIRALLTGQGGDHQD
jgi:mono/diheme cytochrome c family protein